ncbi:hypothetical protein LCGC14_0444780, partial [marine sediment metagenome]
MITKAQRDELVRQGAERRLAKKPKPVCARCHITKDAHRTGQAFIVGQSGDSTTMTACPGYKEA